MQKLFEKLTNPAIIILVAAILRLVPHAPNFAPIGAMALFGGAYLGRRSAIALPIAAMVLSDLFLGFDGFASRLTVYGTFICVGFIGLWLREHKSFQNTVFASLAASVLFFATTNFGVWAFGSLYPKTIEGLVACYTAAIPFFRNTLMGDLFYTGVFFGGYELMKDLAQGKTLAILGKGVEKNG